MKNRISVSLAVPLCALAVSGALVTAGCGGGGGSSSPSGPPPTLASAEAGLNSLVRGSQPLTITNLQTASTQFAQAKNAAPGNKDAQLGYAISTAALAGAQFANIEGSVVPQARQANAHALARASRLSQLGQALTLWRLPQALAGRSAFPQAGDLMPQPLAVLPHASSTLTPAQVQTALKILDDSLANVETALGAVSNDPNYVYTLADPSKPSDTTATVKVGQAEIKVLTTAVNAVRAVANLGLAYNADTGSFDFTSPVPASFSSQSAVTPTDYLPGGGFATLNADGKARLGATKQELNNTADNGVAAIEQVKTRNNAGYLLDPGTLVTTDELNSAETQIKSYQAYLNGPQDITVTLGGSTVTTSLDVSAFLSNPPADLKALAPTLVGGSDANGPNLTLQSFPDPQFGGLFPAGLPVNQLPRTPLTLYPASDGYAGTTYNDILTYIISFD